MNEHNGPGTHGARYIEYVCRNGHMPSNLTVEEIHALFLPENMPPSIRRMQRDFALWLLDEQLTPHARLAVEAQKEKLDARL